MTLDLRVAPDLRLGDDPAALPPDMRAQAEPHIARSPVDPDFLTAVFQEGRFTDGGAVDCGFSVTHDGGLSWTRMLIPNLTMASGGTFVRATDPVAGIDLSGRVFLNTEAATTADFSDGTILVSRSTDGGATFEAPFVVYRPPNSSIFPDKPWMAINTFSGTSTVGRIVVTWTQFGTTEASPIFRAYSDDHGVTWSEAAPIHAATTVAQGSQPVFLRDGRLAIIYWNFSGSGFTGGDAPAPGPEEIEMVLSNDGGVTFGAPTPVTSVARYDQPSIRNGVFLPSATTDRISGHLSLVYQGLDTTGQPRIFFTKTTNAGATWTTPVAITDNPGTGVFNAAIAAAPDGQRLTASFYDQRDNPPGDTIHCNLYFAQSLDGGATWAAQSAPNECNYRRVARAADGRRLHARRLSRDRAIDQSRRARGAGLGRYADGKSRSIYHASGNFRGGGFYQFPSFPFIVRPDRGSAARRTRTETQMAMARPTFPNFSRRRSLMTAGR